LRNHSPLIKLLNFGALLLGTYKQVMRRERALATFGFGMIGRLPMAMNPVAIVLLVSTTKNSFATAGFASAAYTLAGSLIGPRVGQWADRHGTRRVLVPITALHMLAMVGLILARKDGLLAILFLSAAAGATLPSIGSYTRTRWSRAISDPRELVGALSIESVLDEIAFVTGPALAGLLYVKFDPSIALYVGLGFLFVGATGMALSSSHHDIAEDTSKRLGGLMHIRLVKPLLLSLIALGGVFGGNTVAILAVAKEVGHSNSGGLLVAMYSLGSLVAGALYGMRHWHSSPGLRYALALLLMTIATLGPITIQRYGALGYLVIFSGVAISPTLIAANALLKELVPSDRLNEAFSYLGASISIGITIGSAISGQMVHSLGPWHGFDYVLLSSIVATCVAYFGLVHRQKGEG
jgi:MFS family permease